MAIVLTTEIPGLQRHATGKVRDVYRVGDDALLLVTTDRISAFDVVLEQGIPDKGRVLTQMSAYWFTQTRSVIENHMISADDATIFARLAEVGVTLSDILREQLSGRSMLCHRATPLPIEAVVRGYLSGSAWAAYQNATVTNGTVDLWGVSLPADLQESDQLPAPIFTPSTKATEGHDAPMHQSDVATVIGSFAEPVEKAAKALYGFAYQHAKERGILLADTKFEFGTLPDPQNGFRLVLIDEALTPDSSRYWDAATYAPGRPQPSFDKQFVRDYLLSIPGWDRTPPAPPLPDSIVAQTAEKYRDAYRRITGETLPS